MSGVCAGIKRSGGRCTVSVESGQYCHHHDPDRASERSRAASKAGRSKPSRELSGIKTLLSDLTDQVLAGSLLPGPAAVANQLINTRLRAVELERKIREADELEGRIAELERSAGSGEGSRSWGA